MERARDFRFVANKVYTIPGKGVVVTGRVDKGSVSVGDEIGFIGTSGQMTGAVVAAIEVSRRLVETAQAGEEASLLLEGVRKDQIVQGTVLMEAPEASPRPVTPAAAGTVQYETAEPSPLPQSPAPISPSSGWGRSVMYILIGLLILLALLFFQGKLDSEKWDPRKWDPRKKRASIEPSAAGDQLSYSVLSPGINARLRGHGGYDPVSGGRREG